MIQEREGSMSETLAPCPFCGADGACFGHGYVGEQYGIVTCADCGGAMQVMPGTEAEAIAAWNTRATDEHPLAEDYRNRAERAEQEATELRETVARLREAVVKARNQFRHYGDLHKAKGTNDGDLKAAVNWSLAMDMDTALENPDG